MNKQSFLSNEIPDRISDSDVLYLLQTENINWSYMQTLKEFAATKDEVII